MRPDDKDRRNAMFKNSHMRLLMKLVGLQLLDPASEETPESAWIIPSDVSADVLKDAIHYINQAEFSPPTFEEGVLAEHQLKRKSAPRKKADFDDDEDGEPDNPMFGPLGPTVRRPIDEEDGPKKSPRKRRPRKELTEEERQKKRKERRRKEQDRLMSFRSEEFVRPEDDETDSEYDEAFFAREREIKAKAAAIRHVAERLLVPRKPTRKRGIAATESASSSEEHQEGSGDSESGHDSDPGDDFILRAMNTTLEEENEGQPEGTLPDGSDGESRKRRRISVEKTQPDEDEEMGGVNKNGDEDEDEAPVVTRRPRVRGGFVVDSDDDE